MQIPKITLNREAINALGAANAAQHAQFATTPASILVSLQEDLNREAAGEAVNLLSAFIGMFNQLTKCETGTSAFQANILTLPPCFTNLSDAITNNNPAAVGSFVVQPVDGWAQMVNFCTVRNIQIQVAAVRQALLSWENIVHAHPLNMQQRTALGRTLIQALLIPILQFM